MKTKPGKATSSDQTTSLQNMKNVKDGFHGCEGMQKAMINHIQTCEKCQKSFIKKIAEGF